MSPLSKALNPRTASPAPLYAAGFVTAFGAHAVAANLALYAVERHSSLWELGLVLGVYDAAEVVLKPVFGSLVDRRGAKPVMVGGLAAFALASGAFALVGQAHWLGVARFAQGCAAAAFSPAAGAALAASGGSKRTGRLFGGYGGAKGIGYLLGPVAGGALVQLGGYRALFGVVATVAMVAMAWVVVGVNASATSSRSRCTLRQLVTQLGNQDFLRPVLLLACGAAALSAGVGFLPLLGANHHLTPLVTGALVSLLAATAAVTQPLVGRRHDGRGMAHAAPPLAIVVMAAGFLLAAMVPNAVGIIAAALLIGLGVGVVTPVGFSMLAASSSPERLGRTMGAGEVGRELGDAGGPVLVGAFGSAGLGAGFLALAGVLVVCGGLVFLRRSTPSSSTISPPISGE